MAPKLVTRKLRGTQLVTLIYLYIVMVVVLEVFAATFKMTSHLVLLDAIKA